MLPIKDAWCQSKEPVNRMNDPDSPNGGIAASLGQATGYQAEIIIALSGGGLKLNG